MMTAISVTFILDKSSQAITIFRVRLPFFRDEMRSPPKSQPEIDGTSILERQRRSDVRYPPQQRKVALRRPASTGSMLDYFSHSSIPMSSRVST